MGLDVFKKCKIIGQELGFKDLEVITDKIREIDERYECKNYQSGSGFKESGEKKTNMKTYVLMKKGDELFKDKKFFEACVKFQEVIELAEPEDDFENL
jgi:hypothetical protein